MDFFEKIKDKFEHEEEKLHDFIHNHHGTEHTLKEGLEGAKLEGTPTVRFRVIFDVC